MADNRRNTDLNDRQRKILKDARKEGVVQVDKLSLDFDITPQTIRRDLTLLCGLNLLQRVHGGAIAHDGVSNLGYEARLRLLQDEKEMIGKYAAALIPNDCSMILNIGTTTEQVATNLVNHVGMLVITNNINIVNLLMPYNNIDVMTAGGIVRKEDGGVVGDTTVDFFSQFKVDYAVISSSALEEDGTILDFDSREVRVTRTIISNARSVILLSDSTKMERNAPIRIGDISQVDYIVTDACPSQKFQNLCIELNVKLVIATEHRKLSKSEGEQTGKKADTK
ncbi:MAG: DeoR/GlpR transcriptional regulator [Proteobacteria bacterium]|nr:DeoR/GlpR transcriptional regulator [Pseudomonadota bacterium]